MKRSMDILAGSTAAGTLTAAEDGLYTRFHAVCRYDQPGIHRLTLERDGCAVPLGVLMPENGCLVLRRRLSNRTLAPLGPEGPSICRIAEAGDAAVSPSPAGWQPCPEPEKLFADRELSRICPRQGALIRKEGTRIRLALPMKPDAPFPLLPVFLWGSTGTLGGRSYVIFTLENGECC